MEIFTTFLFGSETNLSSPIAKSNIPLRVFKASGSDFLSNAKFIKTLAEFDNGYQWAKLDAYEHPEHGLLLWFHGEHETGMWSWLLKPVEEKMPKITLQRPML